jgi:hypothetical protein
LRDHRPVLLFEVSERALQNVHSSSQQLLEFLRSFGYDVYTFSEETGLPVAAKPGELSDTMVASPIEQPIANISSDDGSR